MKIAVVGLGLIGGSMALKLKAQGFATTIVGVEENEAHAARALDLGLVEKILPLEQAVEKVQLIILAVPVDATERLLPELLDQVANQVVIDVGSTKKGVLDCIQKHAKRAQFVATHPMWGTEYSGPQAATAASFSDKAAVICGAEDSSVLALDVVKKLYAALQMHLVFMTAEDHDVHVAYVSHISHITSFALANTVLEKEKEEEAIFELASGGFESTVRLAKSNAAMWVPVLMQNKENVLDVLNEHISQLRKFKASLEKENYQYLEELIVKANSIKRIIK